MPTIAEPPPTDGEIRRIRMGQEQSIGEVRDRMTAALSGSRMRDVLTVGEGCDRFATWLGQAIRRQAVGGVRLAVPLDRRAGPWSFHRAGPPAGAGDLRIGAILADATRSPFPTASFDACVASLMVDDCADPAALVAELCRCCRPNGLIALSGHGLDARPAWRGVVGILGAHHDHQLGLEDIEVLLRDEPLEVVERWHDHHAWLRVARRT
ncbi:MAG: methyltransferase domain-containing protein [Acidimicrobiales bacterium]|nr:methyltransferase domain-containing protein [Acidimicrobiales bacterium]